MDSSADEILVIWGYPWIDTFLDIFKRTEVLFRKMILNGSTQLVFRRIKCMGNIPGGVAHLIRAYLAFLSPFMRHGTDGCRTRKSPYLVFWRIPVIWLSIRCSSVPVVLVANSSIWLTMSEELQIDDYHCCNQMIELGFTMQRKAD